MYRSVYRILDYFKSDVDPRGCDNESKDNEGRGGTRITSVVALTAVPLWLRFKGARHFADANIKTPQGVGSMH